MVLKMHDKKRLALCLSAWLLVALCMAEIFYLSGQVRADSAELSRGYLQIINDFFGTNISHNTVRKAAHTFEYFLLAAFVFNAVALTWQKARPYFAFIFSVLYSVTDEIHQIFVPGRGCRFTDVMIDAAGAALGILLCLAVPMTAKKLKRKKTGKLNQ
jgi:VanZ family protein